MAVSAQAQVIWVEPVFPKESDTVTVYFDASEGNGELSGVVPVYAHTGVITNKSTSGSDWKHVVGNWGTDDARVKMTYIGNNVHKLRYPMKSFYAQGGAFTQGEVIEQMAFVFRNAAGTKVGRSAQGTDIYTPVYSTGLFTKVIWPEGPAVLGNAGSTHSFEAWASKDCQLILTLNGDTLQKRSAQDSLQASFGPLPAGNHWLVFTATDGSLVRRDSIRYTMNPSVSQKALPTGMQQGLNRLSDSSACFVLRAPMKSYVYLLGDFNQYLPDVNYFMNYSSAEGVWWLTVEGLKPNLDYGYQYLVNGDTRVADPYSELMLSQWDDAYIPAATFPNLKPYPKNETTGWVSVFRTNKASYNWKVNDFQRPDKDRLVIYECLLRDFTKAQNYQSLIDTLSYLKRLGITALQLMPVAEFEGNLSWGYNPASHMALDKYYGTPEKFKELVDACHALGMAVILDVVYNHAFSSSPICQLYWDATNFKPSGNSIYANPDAKHPFNVGFDLNHESQDTRYYTKRTLDFWLDEYRIDGFRFDLSKGFTQKNSGSDVGAWGAYDQSRINIWDDYYQHIQQTSPGAYVILEHFADNSEESVLVNKGMMIWGNANHAFTELAMAYPANSDYAWGIDSKARGWNWRHLVGYAESHDEERMAYKCLAFGANVSGYNTKSLNTYVERSALAHSLLLLTPGPKMIWQFGELGYDFSINRCEDGSIKEECRLSNKPVRWDYWTASAPRQQLYYKTAALNHLKTEYAAIHKPNSHDYISSGKVKRLRTFHSDLNMVVLGNVDPSLQFAKADFAHTGVWYDYLSNDSLVVDNTAAVLTLEPGEYRVYLDQRVANPFAEELGLNVAHLAEDLADSWLVYPNPSQGQVWLMGDGWEWLVVRDIQGREWHRQSVSSQALDLSFLAAGSYLLELGSASGERRSTWVQIQP